jgi:ATP/maltotriose-dependent transcriptional regulator MalT
VASPLLATKLSVPGWRRGLVARPRLIERLNRGAAASGKPMRRQSLAEPLSERELEVLRLLGTDLKGPLSTR